MINTNKETCCGCMSCVQACPKQCISLKRDVDGFDYPIVEESNCVNCNLCKNVCPVASVLPSVSEKKCYAIKHRNKQIQHKSSSGGMFSALCEFVMKKNGVVIAAKFDRNWNVIHCATESKEEIEKFLGSKYVQSKIGDTYKDAEYYLKKGKTVLFVGTPCQIGGLNLFLRKHYDNLITSDFICHGVPSPGVWQKYLSEEIYMSGQNSRIKDIKFRDKSNGWKNYRFVIDLEKNDRQLSLSSSRYVNPFMKGFLNDLFLRPSCHNCKYKENNSGSDFTMGDFWQVRSRYPKFYDKEGVSLLIARSQKALDILAQLDVDSILINYNEILKSNQSLVRSTPRHPKIDVFWNQMNSGEKRFVEIVNEMIPNKKESISAKSVLADIVYHIRKML